MGRTLPESCASIKRNMYVSQSLEKYLVPLYSLKSTITSIASKRADFSTSHSIRSANLCKNERLSASSVVACTPQKAFSADSTASSISAAVVADTVKKRLLVTGSNRDCGIFDTSNKFFVEEKSYRNFLVQYHVSKDFKVFSSPFQRSQRVVSRASHSVFLVEILKTCQWW